MPVCEFTPSRCHVNLAALRRNFARLGEAARLMPVIKADAYGHGLLPVARTLADAGAQRFAVGLVDEGRALRDAGFSQRIVPLLGQLSPEDWQRARALDILPLIAGPDDVARAAALADAAHPWKVAIKLDSGMGRLGFTPEDIPALLEALRAAPALRPALALSHFAVADTPDEQPYTLGQLERFTAMTDALRAVFPDMERSLDNSAGTLAWPQARFEVCRPGYAVYGGNPLAGTDWADKGGNLEWVMSFSAPVIQTRSLAKGQTISYGRIFTAPRDMRIAVLGCGYANAVPRALSNTLPLRLHGRRVPQVGRICMGMMMVDISALENVQPGDRAWLLGGPEGPDAPVTPDDWAAPLETIAYELLCLVGMTNPRVYEEA